jgi:GT2 family glycosyltransferase
LYKLSNSFGKYYAQHLEQNESGKVDILVGAFMVMQRELYNEIGGFDENCFMYSDDIDLSYMVLQKEKHNYYYHETSVIHYKGESTVRDERYMKRFQEAMQFFYKKHFQKSFVFDFFMRIGAMVFSLIKKNQSKEIKSEIDEYIIFSKDLLQLDLKKKQTILNDFSQFKNDLNAAIEIIFDTNSFSFKEIIEFMNCNKSEKLTFKNYISESNFIIGSNNSIDRGEIIILKN